MPARIYQRKLVSGLESSVAYDDAMHLRLKYESYAICAFIVLSLTASWRNCTLFASDRVRFDLFFAQRRIYAHLSFNELHFI